MDHQVMEENRHPSIVRHLGETHEMAMGNDGIAPSVANNFGRCMVIVLDLAFGYGFHIKSRQFDATRRSRRSRCDHGFGLEG